MKEESFCHINSYIQLSVENIMMDSALKFACLNTLISRSDNFGPIYERCIKIFWHKSLILCDLFKVFVITLSLCVSLMDAY